MADLVWVSWYATVLRQDYFAEEVARMAPVALRYGATQYQVHVNNDDRYRITQMTWVTQKRLVPLLGRPRDDRVPGPQQRASYQIPITYAWADEIAAGTLGPRFPRPSREPEPEPLTSRPSVIAAALTFARPQPARCRLGVDPQRDLQPEPAVGFVERVAEQLPQPAEAVAGRLGMDAEPVGNAAESALLGQPDRAASPRQAPARRGVSSASGASRSPASSAASRASLRSSSSPA